VQALFTLVKYRVAPLSSFARRSGVSDFSPPARAASDGELPRR